MLFLYEILCSFLVRKQWDFILRFNFLSKWDNCVIFPWVFISLHCELTSIFFGVGLHSFIVRSQGCFHMSDYILFRWVYNYISSCVFTFFWSELTKSFLYGRLHSFLVRLLCYFYMSVHIVFRWPFCYISTLMFPYFLVVLPMKVYVFTYPYWNIQHLQLLAFYSIILIKYGYY